MSFFFCFSSCTTVSSSIMIILFFDLIFRWTVLLQLISRVFVLCLSISVRQIDDEFRIPMSNSEEDTIIIIVFFFSFNKRIEHYSKHAKPINQEGKTCQLIRTKLEIKKTFPFFGGVSLDYFLFIEQQHPREVVNMCKFIHIINQIDEIWSNKAIRINKSFLY